MITPLLEKAIFNGWATYKVFNHAFSSFGELQIPQGHMAIVTDIKWNHFLNTITTGTYNDMFKVNEYQLKIDCNKNINYLIFRNKYNFKITDPSQTFKLSDAINQTFLDDYVLPEPSNPIIQDVFFVAEEFIRITITRNAFINTVNTAFGQLDAIANQPPSPTGIGNQNVFLRARMRGTSPSQSLFYNPPLYKNQSTPFSAGQSVQNYYQVIANNGESMLSDVPINPLKPYSEFPLVQLGVVLFNNQYFDRIMNG